MTNRFPAKFLICKKIPCELDLGVDDDELWKEHDRLARNSERLSLDIKNGKTRFDGIPETQNSFLDLKIELINRILSHCNFCEWNCRVDRKLGIKLGACRLDSTSRVSTWFLHKGEEPPISGASGSGTIFFTGCIFRCVFCQNWDIAQYPRDGLVIDGNQLALIMRGLRSQGAHNINFVGGEPTPHLHTILGGMNHLDLNVPMLWNSDMYASVDAMKILRDIIDIWLPDFKYGNNECALRLSKVTNYFSTVSRNHLLAYKSGEILIRHLVLPNHMDCCTRPILGWISENCPKALVNVMGQYHPDHKVLEEPSKYPQISRGVTQEEMGAAYRCAEEFGLLYRPVSC